MRASSLPLRDPSSMGLFMIPLVFCSGITLAGWRYYQAQRRSIDAEVQNQISAIADLKVQQIVAWRRERLADAVLLASNPLVAAPPSIQSQLRLQAWLESFRLLYGYKEVAVLNSDGRALNVASEDASPDNPQLGRLIQAALQSGDSKASELTRGSFGAVYLDFVAPVLSAGAPAGRAVLLRAEASAFLYALVDAWPTPNATAECLLIRREGDQVRYLNQPKHQKGAALDVSGPLQNDALAANALGGVEDVRAGRDYRGIPVLAALRKVPETDWALIAKVDADEIYRPLRYRTYLTAVMGALLSSVCFAACGLLYQRQKHKFWQQQVEAEHSRQTLAGRYAHLSGYVNDIILLLDEDGHILEANDRAAETYGYSREELLRMSIQALLDDSDLPGCTERLGEINNGGSVRFESKHRRRDGSLLLMEVSCRVVESQGRKLHQSVIRDITQRKAFEEALRRSTRAMRVLSASNQSLVRSSDEADLFQSICHAATTTGGYPLAWIGFAESDKHKSLSISAMAGDGISYLESIDITWGEEPRGNGPTGRCIRTGRTAVCNGLDSHPDFEPWRHKAAQFGYRAALALPLRCEAEIIGALTIYAFEPDAFGSEEIELLEELASDLSYGITAHRRRLAQARTEEALLQSALEFRTLFDAANDSIFIIDIDGRFLAVNQVASDRLGYTRAELLTMGVSDIDSPGNLPARKELAIRILQGGNHLFETAHVRKDGTQVTVEINSCLFQYRGNQAILSVARDISERKRMEALARQHARELEQAKIAAENASRAKSQFLANMSHEIRTPMNGIIATSGLLLDTPLTPEQRDLAETIRTSADALLAIVNDVLDFSKIEAGRMKIECVSFDIVTRLSEIGDLLTPQICAKGLNYEFHADVEHRWVNGDAGRMRQIVLNLLGNAIKFTDQGQVILRVSQISLGAGRATFEISVTDSGVGIAEADLPLLFQKFAQVDSSLSKRHQGTGLGLAISHRLAELMNATLTVTSEFARDQPSC